LAADSSGAASSPALVTLATGVEHFSKTRGSVLAMLAVMPGIAISRQTPAGRADYGTGVPQALITIALPGAAGTALDRATPLSPF
jgi:hypothetical protein